MFIMSGCSGAGKNTIINKLMAENENVDIFTSITTRKMRENEVQGNPFFYYTIEEFEEKEKQGKIIEKEFIHGNYYGTSYEVLEQKLANNKILIKDIGVEGTLSLQQKLKDKVKIIPVFLDVPRKELIKRITLRGEPKDRVKVRASRFSYELTFKKNYEYVFKFLPLEKSVSAVNSLIELEESNFSQIYSLERPSNKKIEKYIKKLEQNKQIPKVKLGFFNNNLVVLKNLDCLIAGQKTQKFVQKIVLDKEVDYAVCYKI